MAQLRFEVGVNWISAAGFLFAVGLSVMPIGATLAANHPVSAESDKFDCDAKGVRPGDTVTLAAGTRGPLKIRNCNGTASKPITIRNDPDGTEPTTIRRASGPGRGIVFSCDDCIGVAIDGSYKWRGAPRKRTYGIIVTITGGGAPAAFVRIGGMSRFVTIRNLEIDGAWPGLASDGIGLSVNDHAIKRSVYPNVWREGFLIERNYIHDIEGEGMYVGPNYRDGDLPLRDIEIRFNIVEDIGWEGINTKSMLAGSNSVHHNMVRRVGKNDSQTNKPNQYAGINNNTGSVKIYNNWVEDTGTHGIKVGSGEGPPESSGFGPFKSYVWNNVVVNAGGLWRPFMSESHGISISAQAGREKPAPFVYNNTIINPRGKGIHLANNVAEGFVRDNIVAGTGAGLIQAPPFVKQSNNRIGRTQELRFIDADRKNFRLRPDSPARNVGSEGSPETDFDGRPRPQDGVPDQGAFEFTNSATQSKFPESLVEE